MAPRFLFLSGMRRLAGGGRPTHGGPWNHLAQPLEPAVIGGTAGSASNIEFEDLM